MAEKLRQKLVPLGEVCAALEAEIDRAKSINLFYANGEYHACVGDIEDGQYYTGFDLMSVFQQVVAAQRQRR